MSFAKTMQYVFLAFFLLVFCLNTNAFAISTATTSTMLNWESILMDSESGDYTNYSYLASTGIRADTRNNDTYYPGETIREIGTTSNSIENAFSQASADRETLSTYASATADGIVSIDIGATADLHRTADFKVTQAGTFTFSLNYNVENSFEVTLPEEDNYGGSRIALFFAYHDDDGVYTVVGDEDIFNFNNPGSYSGTLSITRDLPLEDYSFEAHIYSSVGASSPQQTAPVPEPSTWLLLGTGLAGLAFYRRKRK